MYDFINYLINEKGYKPYRHIYNKSTKQFVDIEETYNNIHYFSSSISGYLDLWLRNENNHFVFGGVIPRLVFPLPKDCQHIGTRIDRLFSTYTNEELYFILTTQQ